MFPAYSAKSLSGDNTSLGWLSNSSFVPELSANSKEKENENSDHEETRDNEKEQLLIQYLSEDSSSEGGSEVSNNATIESGTSASHSKQLDGSKKHYGQSRNELEDRNEKQRERTQKKSKKRSPSREHSRSRHNKKKKKKVDDASDEEHYRSHSHHKKKKKKHKGDKHKRKKSKDPDVKSKDRISDTLPILPNKVFIDDIANLKPEHAFRIDRGKDDNNLAYGSIFSEHIARKYQLVNSSLGKYKGNVIYLKEKTHQKVDNPRYYHKEFVKQSKLKGMACDKITEEAKIKEFIPVMSSKKTTGSQAVSDNSAVNPLGIYDTGTELWLQGKGKSLINVTEGEETISSFHETRSKMAQYNKQLNEEPNNIKLWLEFADFQEKEAGITKIERNIDDVTQNRPLRGSVAEIKMAVLNKAIEKNPECMKLKMARIELWKDLWDTDDMLKQWNSLLFQYSNSGPLWVKYLEFRQSWASRFSISGVLKAFEKAIKTLSSIVKGEMKSHSALPNTEYYLIYIFSQACRMLSEAGHQEKAIAMYQAIIEYNIFYPDILKDASLSDTKDFFEAFWEGMAPRVGEDGAHGWKAWIDCKGQGDKLIPWSNRETDEQIEEKILEQKASICKTWFSIESSRNQRHWLPWRPNINSGETDDDCEDPDRQVLSDDATSCLFKLQTENEKFLLICHFLQFLGVKIQILSTEVNDSCTISWSDNAFSEINCDKFNLLQETRTNLQNLEYLETFVCNLFEQITPHFSSDYKLLLYLAFFKYKLTKCIKSGATNKECKALRKWAKSLLKGEENRMCLLLWEQFALMEWTFGNKTEALKVIGVTLKSSANVSVKGLTDLDRRTDICRLYRDYAELYLGVINLQSYSLTTHSSEVTYADKTYITYLLYSLATGDTFLAHDEFIEGQIKSLSVSKIMKAKRQFTEQIDEIVKLFLSSKDNIPNKELLLFYYNGSLLIHFVTCAAYFIYLTEDFKSAADLFVSILRQIKPENDTDSDQMFNIAKHYCYQQYRILYEVYIGFCKYHTDVNPTAPLRMLRDPLTIALEDLPTNTTLLELYVMVESQASIAGRVRQYFRQAVSETGAAQVWLFAVLAELIRKQKFEEYDFHNQLSCGDNVLAKETGITHQMRAWFERAVSHPVARQSVLLWRLYALFEVGQQHLHQAKAVFYRALQHCPGAKALYMDMAHSMEDLLSQVTDLMVERELRLRTPLEEVQILLKSDTDNIESIAETQDNTEEKNNLE